MTDNHGDVGSYVAHALLEDERRAFEDHQDICETCAREHEEFDETLAELAILSATPPPASLRGDLLAAVRLVRPLPPVERRPPVGRRSVITLPQPFEMPRMYDPDAPRPGAVTAGSARTTGSSGSVTSIDAAPRRRRLVPMLASLVAAVMVVALSLGVWVHTLGEQHRVDVAASAEEARLLSAPDAKIYSSTLEGATVSYVVSRRLDRAMLIGTDLPDPGRGRAYQLWRITKSGAQPAGLVHDGGSVHQWFEGSLVEAGQLAITLERSGGAASPTLPPRSAVQL